MQRPEKEGGYDFAGTGECIMQPKQEAQISFSLNSLKGGYIGDYLGDYYKGY